MRYLVLIFLFATTGCRAFTDSLDRRTTLKEKYKNGVALSAHDVALASHPYAVRKKWIEQRKKLDKIKNSRTGIGSSKTYRLSNGRTVHSWWKIVGSEVEFDSWSNKKYFDADLNTWVPYRNEDDFEIKRKLFQVPEIDE
jgi:hypothetical protein